jgi:hypothetical protein
MTPEVAATYLALSVLAGILGRNRRIGFWGYLFASLIFTPCITLVFIFLATPRKT